MKDTLVNSDVLADMPDIKITIEKLKDLEAKAMHAPWNRMMLPGQGERDAAFIVALRNAFPSLIAEVERQKCEVEDYHTSAVHWKTKHDELHETIERLRDSLVICKEVIETEKELFADDIKRLEKENESLKEDYESRLTYLNNSFTPKLRELDRLEKENEELKEKDERRGMKFFERMNENISLGKENDELKATLSQYRAFKDAVEKMDIPNHKVNELKCESCGHRSAPSGDFYHLCDQWRSKRDAALLLAPKEE